MRLGRLAIDTSFQKQQLGKFLLLQAMRRTQDVADICGCALLTLDTNDDDARSFYLKMKFIPHLDNPTSMFFLVSWIRQMNLRPIIEPVSISLVEGHDYQI
jgi:hypothetical protein